MATAAKVSGNNKRKPITYETAVHYTKIGEHDLKIKLATIQNIIKQNQ